MANFTDRAVDEISISSIYHSILSKGGNVRRSYDQGSRPSRSERRATDSPTWTNHSSGIEAETADVVCPNCWRIVKRCVGPHGARCPRCGGSLPLLRGSSNAEHRDSGAALVCDGRGIESKGR